MKKLLLILGFIIIGISLAQLYEPSKRQFKGDLNEQVTVLRDGYDLPPLEQDQELDFVAQQKCNDMAIKEYFSHQSEEGLMVWEQFEFSYTKAGENLAIGMDNAFDTVKAWQRSKTHLGNIVDPAYTKVGYAVCVNKDNHFMVVQILKG